MDKELLKAGHYWPACWAFQPLKGSYLAPFTVCSRVRFGLLRWLAGMLARDRAGIA